LAGSLTILASSRLLTGFSGRSPSRFVGGAIASGPTAAFACICRVASTAAGSEMVDAVGLLALRGSLAGGTFSG
jgi:hypothetical protein